MLSCRSCVACLHAHDPCDRNLTKVTQDMLGRPLGLRIGVCVEDRKINDNATTYMRPQMQRALVKAKRRSYIVSW